MSFHTDRHCQVLMWVHELMILIEHVQCLDGTLQNSVWFLSCLPLACHYIPLPPEGLVGALVWQLNQF